MCINKYVCNLAVYYAESHNFVSVIGVIWLVSMFAALLVFLVWANFETNATTDSVKQK